MEELVNRLDKILTAFRKSQEGKAIQLYAELKKDLADTMVDDQDVSKLLYMLDQYVDAADLLEPYLWDDMLKLSGSIKERITP